MHTMCKPGIPGANGSISVRSLDRLRIQMPQATVPLAGFATTVGILTGMLPSHGYQGFSAAPPPSGWVQMGEGWVLWWSGRQIAHVTPAKNGGVRVHLDARKM